MSFNPFRILSEKYLAFRQKLSDRVFETAMCSSMGTSLVEFFFWEKKLLSFSDIKQKLLGFSLDLFGSDVKTASHVSIGTLWGESVVYGQNVFHQIWTLMDLQLSGKYFLGRVFRTAFYVSIGNFRELIFLRIMFSSSFPDIERKVFDFLSKFLR